MARQRNPNRDEAKRKWLESFGTIPTRQLAEEAGVSESRVRKWKSEDGWKEALEKQQRKRGGQPGNRNAAGAGAPIGNKNAETHGAYSTVHLDDLPPARRAYIESITLDTAENMLRELQLLMAKEEDLKARIRALEDESADTLHVDKVVEMLVPRKAEDGAEDQPDDGQQGDALKTAMQTIIKASPFDRAMKLEAELNKTHGRIIKLLDSIKSYELDTRRLDLEEKKYRLAKQKITGEFEVDPDTGEIDDVTDDDGGLLE
ncbi:phage terminase small subunit [Enterocloster aldenensis]|uniref:phage terminase small subunit n=1 Tax=Enterocloster aldenensis TaxID=358742 RepID=UPI0040285E95